jgi:chaperone required for assembly of F1-ATPase
MPFNRAKPDNAERPRRFWKAAFVGERDPGGWPVLLDGRVAKTPGGKPLALSSEALARLVAAEWDAQGERFDYASMPTTRLAHTAIESVPDKREAVAAEVARYAGSDLLCYHAEDPTELAALHAREWGPVLDWADRELGVRLIPTAGIIHLPQPPESVERAKALALELDDFALTGLAAATALFGSAILGFALQRGRLDGDEAFDLSRLDEAFQERQWGVDEEAAQRTANRRAEARALEAWFRSMN